MLYGFLCGPRKDLRDFRKKTDFFKKILYALCCVIFTLRLCVHVYSHGRLARRYRTRYWRPRTVRVNNNIDGFGRM